MLATGHSWRLSRHWHPPPGLAPWPALEQRRTPGALAQIQNPLPLLEPEILGQTARGDYRAPDPHSRGNSRLPHPQNHSGHHAIGRGEISSQHFGSTVSPSLELGTEFAPFENDPPNGTLKLQNAAHGSTRTLDPCAGAQPDPPPDVRSGAARRRSLGSREFCRSPRHRPPHRGSAPPC